MRWPKKIEKGMVYNEPIIALDIFATVVGQVQPALETNQLDGVDLLPYLSGTCSGPPHSFLFWTKFDNGEYAARNAKGEKIISTNDKAILFDLGGEYQ